jgi:hypothetical protein
MDLNVERDDDKDDMAYDPHRDHAMPREGHVGGLDPLDITQPRQRLPVPQRRCPG